MSDHASERKRERLATCCGALCAVVLAVAVVLMGRATFDTAQSAAAQTPPAFAQDVGETDPRFAGWSPPAPASLEGRVEGSPAQRSRAP